MAGNAIAQKQVPCGAASRRPIETQPPAVFDPGRTGERIIGDLIIRNGFGAEIGFHADIGMPPISYSVGGNEVVIRAVFEHNAVIGPAFGIGLPVISRDRLRPERIDRAIPDGDKGRFSAGPDRTGVTYENATPTIGPDEAGAIIRRRTRDANPRAGLPIFARSSARRAPLCAQRRPDRSG